MFTVYCCTMGLRETLFRSCVCPVHIADSTVKLTLTLTIAVLNYVSGCVEKYCFISSDNQACFFFLP